MDSSGYLGLFLDQSRDSLRLLDASLLRLERDPGDVETLAAIFRVAHSLTGMSAAVGLDAMAGLTHHMEDVLAALRLVFPPGLSTARTITAISGRGVGMDAVPAAVEALGGGVDITSIVGEGSAVTFRLPLAQPCPPS